MFRNKLGKLNFNHIGIFYMISNRLIYNRFNKCCVYKKNN